MASSRESHLSYFKTKQEELEVALSTAVRAAVSELHPDPILYVSQSLAAAAAAKSAGSGGAAAGGVSAAALATSSSGVSAGALATSSSARDITTEHVAEVVGMLRFIFQYGGQLVPPRPTAEEVAAGATATGPLVSHGGLIVQGGPFGSVWLRVGADGSGAIVDVPWLTMMENLKCYVEHTMAMQRAKSDAGQIPSAIYCAVTLGASQAVDMAWLASHGFKFFNYAEAGAPGAVAQPACSELIFYAWPGGPTHPDMVPAYATSVEGASGIVLSPDGEQVLLAWERGYWHGCAGAVNPGEGTLDALAREAREELSIEIVLDDPERPPLFMGGYHKSRARDGKVNDNFKAWLVYARSLDFSVDNQEVENARWFNWRELLAAWKADGSPSGWQYNLPANLVPDGKVKCDGKLLSWLAVHEQGGGLKCSVSRKTEGTVTNTTVTIGV